MCEIYNINGFKKIPENAVYVGRGSPFGNPFSIGRDGNRLAVIQKYEKWLKTQPALRLRIEAELKNVSLVCYCAPAYCHAEILYEIANKRSYK